MSEVEQYIDLKGKKCPVPLVRTKQALKKMASGERVVIYVTDITSRDDIDVFYQTGVVSKLEILELNEPGGIVYQMTLEKS